MRTGLLPSSRHASSPFLSVGIGRDPGQIPLRAAMEQSLLSLLERGDGSWGGHLVGVGEAHPVPYLVLNVPGTTRNPHRGAELPVEMPQVSRADKQEPRSWVIRPVRMSSETRSRRLALGCLLSRHKVFLLGGWESGLAPMRIPVHLTSRLNPPGTKLVSLSSCKIHGLGAI